MNHGTRVSAVCDAAGIPESPSGGWCSVGDACGCCLEEVELVGGILIDSTTDEDEQGQQKGAADEDKRNKAEDRSLKIGLV